jgi:hypothetical protein
MIFHQTRILGKAFLDHTALAYSSLTSLKGAGRSLLPGCLYANRNRLVVLR